VPRRAIETDRPALSAFASSSELSKERCRLAPASSPGIRTGSRPTAPPPTSPECVHSGRTVADPPSARRCQSSGPVPPAWFRTTSTVCSASGLAGVLQPAAGPGVHRVSLHLAAFAPLTRPRSRAGRAVGPIPTVPHPSEDSPRSQPYGVAAAAAFLPFAVPSKTAACAVILAAGPPNAEARDTRPPPRRDRSRADAGGDPCPTSACARAPRAHPKMRVAGRGPVSGSEDPIPGRVVVPTPPAVASRSRGPTERRLRGLAPRSSP